MNPIYELSDRSLPKVYAAEYPLRDAVTDVFAIPRRCSVGTISLGNAVSVLDLCGEKVRYETVVRDFTREASGGPMSFLPGYWNDYIGYAKTRSFFLMDLEKRRVQRFRLAPILEYRIHGLAALDWGRRIFAVSLDFTQSSRVETEVQIVDLSGSDVKILADFTIAAPPRWAKLGETTFYFTQGRGTLKEGYTLHALDVRLKEVAHPLVTVFNSGHIPGDLDYPLVHPTLPFAVFGALENGPSRRLALWLTHWRLGSGRVETMKISDSKSGDFRFSPDGKWLLFLDGSTGPDRVMVMPVDPSIPHYLASPMVLQTTEKIDELGSNCAWITDPPAVVCTINRTEHVSTTGEERPVNKLLKWELPRRAGQR